MVWFKLDRTGEALDNNILNDSTTLPDGIFYRIFNHSYAEPSQRRSYVKGNHSKLLLSGEPQILEDIEDKRLYIFAHEVGHILAENEESE